MGTDGKVTAIEKELHRPNGVALSPDESMLYVTQSEAQQGHHHAYSLDEDGNVTGKKLFHDLTDLVEPGRPGLPDGLTVAADGTIFTTGPGGVLVLSKDGKRLGRIWRRQAHRQLQVRRRRPDAVPDLARHAGAHPAQHQRRGLLTSNSGV